MTVESDARYARQRRLPEFGDAGQARLAASRVLIVGVGGLGSPAAQYLAAAGVGTIGLVDDDVVDVSNLHRQPLYGTADVGRAKVDAAASRLAVVNPLVRIVRHETRLTRENAHALIADYHIVLDGTDTFSARYAINDACVALGVPFVYGSVARFEGQVSVFATADGPCYRCLFPEPPAPGSVPTCAEEGVLGVLPGLIGVWQATEVLKWCAGLGAPLSGRLVLFDALGARTQEIRLARRAGCAGCGMSHSVSHPASLSQSVSHGMSQPMSHPMSQSMSHPMSQFMSHPTEAEPAASGPDVLAPETVAAWRAAGTPMQLVDVREPWEHRTAAIAGSRLVPFGTLSEQLDTLDRTVPLVVYCHRGTRSRVAVDWLREQGFAQAASLRGGIDAWSVVVDATIPRY
ncbi:MAG: molybdopterin-synthase adenylyltransferase MoeB [Gemmatimonadaceae bacterium]|nr:molybdopterin-synthase adenylyltransferase MoeB [Gemmatimonadaceae bacterium]